MNKLVLYTNFHFNKNESNWSLDPFIDSYLNKKLKKERYLHSISVANLMLEIAENNNLENKEKYFIAGLLHDVGKYYSKEKTLKLMNKYFSEYLDLPSYAYHSFIGAYLIKKDLEINDDEIYEAIKYHTTGNENLSDLGLVLYAADKIEPLRKYDSSLLIKGMVDDYKTGFVEVLKETKIFLESKGDLSNRLTEKMYQYYLK